MSIILNIDKFIADIFLRPAIWNRNYHCNKSFMEDTWDELSQNHRLPKHVLKAKWKGLRDNFRVEFKRIPRNDNGELLIPPEEFESKWTHYESLLFLVDHMRARHPKTDSQDRFFFLNQNSMDNFDEQIDTKSTELIEIPDDLPPTPSVHLKTYSRRESDPIIVGQSSSHSQVNSPITQMTNGTKRGREDDDELERPEMSSVGRALDDDYHFLMSLHPYMNQLGPSQKLRIRMKIQNLVFKELYKDEVID